MNQPTQTQTVFVRRGPWTANRFLLFVAGVCFFIAAFDVAGTVKIGPWLAWVLGGIAAYLFALVV